MTVNYLLGIALTTKNGTLMFRATNASWAAEYLGIKQ